MVEQARRLNRDIPGCSFAHNGRPDLSAFPDASFDLVYSNIVLQHIHPRFSCAYIREFARLLAPGGIAAFQIPECPANTPVGLAMRVVPVPLLRPLRKMDMYGVPPAKVEAILESGGLRLASAYPDQAAGPNWKSYFYIAVKPAL
jgi:SAM-dependent methyltransferase